MALTHLGGVSGAVVAPVQSYTANVRTTSAETIPAGYSQMVVILDLRQLTSLTASISWTVEYSIDGGSTWISAGGAGINVAASGYTFDGTVLRNAEGGPVRMSGSIRPLPRTDISRQVRVRFTNNETMTIGATVMVL